MKTSISRRAPWLVCTTLAALVSATLRLWQLLTIFEGPLSLPIPNAAPSITLACTLVIAGACFVLLAAYQPLSKRPWTQGQAHRWDRIFLAPSDKVYPTLVVTASFFVLIAVPILFIRGISQWQAYHQAKLLGQQFSDNVVLTIAMAVMALLSFFGLLQMGRYSFYAGQRSQGGFSATLPGIAGCIWLMEYFRSHAADPVLWDYVPQLLAIMCGMLFYMDIAGMSTSAARPRRLLWLAGMTVTLSAVSLVTQARAVFLLPSGTNLLFEQGDLLGDLLLLATQTLVALATLWRLPPNLEYPPTIGSPFSPPSKEVYDRQEDPS